MKPLALAGECVGVVLKIWAIGAVLMFTITAEVVTLYWRNPRREGRCVT